MDFHYKMLFPAVEQDLPYLNSQPQVMFSCNLSVKALCLHAILSKPPVHHTVACTYLDVTR